MKLALLVNDVATEIPEYTTTRLARAAAGMGHDVWYLGVGDLNQGEPVQKVTARGRRAKGKPDDELEPFLERVQGEQGTKIELDTVDALFLRNDSIEDLHERAWASSIGGVFGQTLASRGVTVVNDPAVLTRAASKLYLQEFPPEIRPRCLVTRDADDIRDFIARVGRSVIKPVYGAKGRNVFMVEDADDTNLAQMTEAVLEDGYIIAQEFVEGGDDGDMRVFLLDGDVLEVDGATAAFRRVPQGNDPRANISTGGKMERVVLAPEHRSVIESMRDKLVADGMFFVGIDVIGDKVVEINAESPGGLQAIERLYEVDVCPTIVDALERRSSSTR